VLTYCETIEALHARGRFGVRLGLGRTRALLKELGNPEVGLRGALIGGTNGKGSVQALVASVLREAGVHVAQTPKPHLVSYRERIVVDGRPIAAGDFAALFDEVFQASDRVPKRLGTPTEFELVTAAAFTWFARTRVDVAVIEVGLGGRLDATNTWDGGVAAITNVDWDHMEYLGNTLDAIAREKAPIIKRGDVAVTGATGEPLAVIDRYARRLVVPLEIVAPLPVASMDRNGLVLRDFALGELRVGLLGRHQAANAAVALGVLRAINRRRIVTVTSEQIHAGFAAARWPGRLELVSAGTDVLLDGAHNAAGAAALAAALDELRPSLSTGKPVLLFGVLRDKQLDTMVSALGGSSALRDAEIITTTVPDTPRALPANDVAAAFDGGARPIDDWAQALDAALDAAVSAGGPLIVAGSLYLVGAVRGKLVRDPELIDPED
jgi:dihydrofolate synthase / folylpolyglutamate synthase